MSAHAPAPAPRASANDVSRPSAAAYCGRRFRCSSLGALDASDAAAALRPYAAAQTSPAQHAHSIQQSPAHVSQAVADGQARRRAEVASYSSHALPETEQGQGRKGVRRRRRRKCGTYGYLDLAPPCALIPEAHHAPLRRADLPGTATGAHSRPLRVLKLLQLEQL